MNKTFVAIDYSIRCPCICKSNNLDVSNNKDHFESCKFYYLTDKKKYLIKNNQFCGIYHEDYLHEQERFDNISNWAMKLIPKNSVVLIENYSYSSKGLVYKIGENCGLLKYKLYKKGIKYILVEPTIIKKFFSGKGNSSKDIMYNEFLKRTNIDLNNIFGTKENPVSDIIDSYALCLYAIDFKNKFDFSIKEC